jgi:hypothetical protein
LRVYPERLVIVAEARVVAEHARVFSRDKGPHGQTVYDWRTISPSPSVNPAPCAMGLPSSSCRTASGNCDVRLLKRPGGDREMVEVLALVLLHDEQLVERAVAQALEMGEPSKQHVLNCLSRLTGARATARLCRHRQAEAHDRARGRIRRATTHSGGLAMNPDAMVKTLKAMKLYGMADAVNELAAQASPAYKQAAPVLEMLLKAEASERELRSINYQMKVAKFPAYRDLTGFDFSQSPVDEALVTSLHRCQFLEDAQNIVLVGGPRHRQNPLWPRPSACRPSSTIVSVCGSYPRLSWSTHWSRKSRAAIRGELQTA